jgi:preprotein translocase subunit SecF
MELIKPDINLDFMGRRKPFLLLSALLVLGSITSLLVNGLNLGIDFKGGTKLIVAFEEDAKIDRALLKQSVNEYVATALNSTKSQVEVQDFDTGADSVEPFRRFVIYTELTSVIPTEKREGMKATLEANDALQLAPNGADFLREGETKFFLTFATDDIIANREATIQAAFTDLGFPAVEIESDWERRADLEYYETQALVEQDRKQGATLGSSDLVQEHEVFLNKKIENKKTAQDRIFTVRIDEFKSDVAKVLASTFSNSFVRVESSTSVSASVGKDLLNNGMVAILYALIGILLYIGLRFDFRYSPGAVVALAHDSIITLGLFSILQIKFSQPIIAAVLTIIGYSLNDTIVVFDRIRENVSRMRGKDLVTTINTSINETLSRTILTSMTTMIVIVSILVLGGGLIKDFATALFIGVLIGTYSSVFIASPVVITMDTFFRERGVGTKPSDASKAAA